MPNQNIENLLNLALGATNEEREKSIELGVGYDAEQSEWEVIVKYSGSLVAVEAFAIQVTKLKYGFAVLVVREEDIERLSDIPEIEYVEKPKRLYFQMDNTRRVSCIETVQDALFFPEGVLTGKGVLTAFLDSGIDYAGKEFRNEDGTTRIVKLWDQTLEGIPPEGYHRGREFTEEEINEALSQPTVQERYARVPSIDQSGHGTQVAAVAAGNGRENGKRFRGVASESQLIVVKLGLPRTNSFPRTTELMMALNYVAEEAEKRKLPLAVNISIGNTYGSHEP